MHRFFAILAALFCAFSAHAQTFPQRQNTGVNDFAMMIDEGAEDRISQKLEQIYEDHGKEVSIVTLSSIRFYTEDTAIEDYATDLFNFWAIGDEDENDGILMLVFRDDGEIRIELGAGFDVGTSVQARRVITEDIIPLFRDGQFSDGIEAGIDGLLTRIIDPVAVNAENSDVVETDSGNTVYYIIGGLVAAIGTLVGLSKRNAAKFAKQPCANCGKSGLQKSRDVIQDATLTEEGYGESRIVCPSCSHVETKRFKVSKLRPEGPQGGGGASGGGATGKW